MPPKPTCKVVKRQGQKGARIHPKGCEVRTGVSGAGYATKTKTNKQGLKKYKIKVPAAQPHKLYAASNPNAPQANWVEMLYDTGAQDTTLTQANATKLGYNPNRVASEGLDTVFGGVTAGTARGKLLHNMSFYVQVDPDSDNDWRWVSGSAIVSDELNSENLLGTGHIKGLKSSYNIKFV